MAKKIRKNLVYVLICVVFVFYIFQTSFLATNFFFVPTEVPGEFHTTTYVWSWTEVILYSLFMFMVVALFFGMVYNVWKLGKYEATERKEKKSQKKKVRGTAKEVKHETKRRTKT